MNVVYITNLLISFVYGKLKNKKKSKLVLCQSQNLMMRKVLSLIKKLPLICNCQV